jgi:diphthamide synthase (EF-2-diphthine--ammonia ligase)
VCDSSFARAISTITPELIARLGTKWHGAHNKAAAANVMRNAVIALDMNGLAASCDELAAADKKVEMDVVTRMLCSGQHAARQHRERTAALARELFAQTPPDNDALRDVKLNVFGVEDGKPIMDPK